MSKLDDKLRNLKNDIPKISSELDDKVLNVMLNTPKKPRLSFPKWGVISAALTPVLAMVIILVATNPNSNDPFSSNVNNAEDSGASSAVTNTEQAPGDISTIKFNATRSASVAALDNDSSLENYSHYKLSYATSSTELTNEINKYHPSYQALLMPLTSEMLANNTYFIDYTVALVPFVFSSSEQNIILDSVDEIAEKKETKFNFKLYSPVENDSDIRVFFYVVSLKKEYYDVATNNKLSISVINTRDINAGSVYYDK